MDCLERYRLLKNNQHPSQVNEIAQIYPNLISQGYLKGVRNMAWGTEDWINSEYYLITEKGEKEINNKLLGIIESCQRFFAKDL